MRCCTTEVEIRGLVKRFGKTTAVDDLNLTVRAGSLTTLLGPSGCGKTTTLRIVAGFVSPDEGEVRIGGEVVSSSTHSIPPEKRGMGMVFQSFAVWPHMTVYENVAYGLKLRKVATEDTKRQVSEVLQLVRLEGLEKRYPAQLSGGQQQRVALARALVVKPMILLLDEPLSNLDAKLREEMRLELRDIQQKLALTFIYVTHDQMEATVISDQIVILQAGKVQQVGSPVEIHERPQNEFVARFMGLANLFPGILKERVGDQDSIVACEHGGNIRCLADNRFREGDKVLVGARPENIRLSTAKPTEEDNVIEGVVQSTAYIGSLRDVLVQVSGEVTKVRTDLSPGIGEHVYLWFSPAKCWVIPRT